MSYTFLVAQGGGILGGMLLGHTCVCAVEIEPYCRNVLLQRQRDRILPKFPIWDDVRTFDGKPWRGLVDVVCGGFPCQDIAVGSKTGTGINGERSGLWKHMARVVCEVGPKFVFVENSPALLVRGMGTVLRNLAEMGYDARWGVFSAGDVGARHERERIFLLASNNSFVRQTGSWVERKRGELENDAINRAKSGEDCESAFLEMAKVHARMDDGLAYPVDGVKAIGNGQVPAVVKLAWRTLMGNKGA